MEQLEIVFLTTVVVAMLCISFSTWVTLSDLRAVVFESDTVRPQNVYVPGGALHSFAHHAAEHLPHGIRLSGVLRLPAVDITCAESTGTVGIICRISTR
jgi:hypothetical protein